VLPNRVPAGTRLTRSFPVVHVDEIPVFDPRTWELRVEGAVDHPLRLTWDDFKALPRAARTGDFHAVLGFTRLDNRWEGVVVRDLLGRARLRAAAKFVRFFDGRLYDASIPVVKAMEDDVLLADTLDGRPLTREHGGPVRAVVPSLWGWKSCKWVRTIEVLENDKPGYWEKRGRPSHGDPAVPVK
jgi:DMSO/TMAO reductase YedYZ molybdopterin-dependent catalytic subunit